MGRLSGFKYRGVIQRLRLLGFAFDRRAAGSHEIWRHTNSGRKVTIPHHAKDMPEGALRAILREAQIDIDTFLNGRRCSLVSN